MILSLNEKKKSNLNSSMRHADFADHLCYSKTSFWPTDVTYMKLCALKMRQVQFLYINESEEGSRVLRIAPNEDKL